VYSTLRGKIHALDHISVAVGKGEFVSLLGPSGCGKSTLLKLICGLIAPTTGELRLHDRPVLGPNPEVGMVFQKPNLLPWRTVLDNVLVPARALGLDLAVYRPKARELLDLVGLADFAMNYPRELSGGMQQRVAVARGLLHNPSILLMDEPFAALDAITREQLAAELQRVWLATRKSIVFVTHSIPEGVFLADRVLMMSGRPGRVAIEQAVPLSRPRDIDTMATQEFAGLCTTLRKHLDRTI
jgi:NitT/TauT family transport system ATP-binding protein